MTRYSFTVERAVLEAFAAASARHQRHLLDCFGQLAANPSRPPDWFERDADNRPLSVVVHEDWLVTYWVDDAIRKVMIVEIACVEGA